LNVEEKNTKIGYEICYNTSSLKVLEKLWWNDKCVNSLRFVCAKEDHQRQDKQDSLTKNLCAIVKFQKCKFYNLIWHDSSIRAKETHELTSKQAGEKNVPGYTFEVNGSEKTVIFGATLLCDGTINSFCMHPTSKITLKLFSQTKTPLSQNLQLR
ncbi:hypothetical protein CR513_13938, partial [Mucuna pruriens]